MAFDPVGVFHWTWNSVSKLGLVDELRQAYEEAETDLNRPPYPPIERLRPRLRLAHQHYKTIPKKLAFRRPKAPGP
jgi:hypothetical protein